MNIPVPSLFIGSLTVPSKLRRGREESWDAHQERLKQYKLTDSRVSFGHLQTGGTFCNSQDLFGAVFEISGELLQLCVDTCYIAPITFETMKKYDYDLSKFGLFLSGRGCSSIEEAVISGIDPESLLIYIKKRNLKLWNMEQEWVENSFSNLNDVEEAIRAFWISCGEFACNLGSIALKGAILYENCD